MDIEYRFRPSHQYGYFRSAHHLYTHSSDQGRPPSTKDCPFVTSRRPSPVHGVTRLGSQAEFNGAGPILLSRIFCVIYDIWL